jgi:hypothetical protein
MQILIMAKMQALLANVIPGCPNDSLLNGFDAPETELDALWRTSIKLVSLGSWRRNVWLNDQNPVSFLFWPPVQPFSGLPQLATEDRSDRAASRLRCAKSPLKRAFEMGDLAPFL